MHYDVPRSRALARRSPLGAIPILSDAQKIIGDSIKGLVSMYATTYTPYQVYNLLRFNQPYLGESAEEKDAIKSKMGKSDYTPQWKALRTALINVHKLTTGGKYDSAAFNAFSYEVFKTAYMATCSSMGITPLTQPAASSLSLGDEKAFPWVPVIAGVGVLGLAAVLLMARKQA